MTSTPAPRLTWKRDEFGTYADSATELLRYYVRREGRSWTLEVVAAIEVAGVRCVKPGTNPKAVDRFNATAQLAKGIAQAYDVEPDRAEGKATNRLTRAIERAYDEERAP